MDSMEFSSVKQNINRKTVADQLSGLDVFLGRPLGLRVDSKFSLWAAVLVHLSPPNGVPRVIQFCNFASVASSGIMLTSVFHVSGSLIFPL